MDINENKMQFRSRTPLRISFAGGGTDVSPFPETYGGAVLSATIDKYAYSTLIPTKKSGIRLHAIDLEIKEVLETMGKAFDITYGKGPDFLKAMVKIMKPGKKKFDMTTWCDVPPGSGLGSSSAIMISQISTLSGYLGRNVTSYELAKLAFQIERKELGIKGGLQDQYACTFGGFNFIEFKNNSVIVTPLRLSRQILNELSSSLLLFDTQITRSSSAIIASQIKNYSSDKVIEVLSKMKELAYQAKELVIKGELVEFGKLLHSSWNLKKTVESTISNDRINRLYHQAIEEGAIGGKILGAGGGGHLLLFADPLKTHKVKKRIESLGCRYIPFSFVSKGTESWRLKEGIVEF